VCVCVCVSLGFKRLMGVLLLLLLLYYYYYFISLKLVDFRVNYLEFDLQPVDIRISI